MARLFILAAAVFLASCASMSLPEYKLIEEKKSLPSALHGADIGLDFFTTTSEFNSLCRQAGLIKAPYDASYGEYVQRAFQQELQELKAFNHSAPKVRLSGHITKLSFTTLKAAGTGEWHIELRLLSSNGAELVTSASHEFPASIAGSMACWQTAQAAVPTVQKLVQATLADPGFAALVRQ